MKTAAKHAMHEATVDTCIALPLNFILNYIILRIAFEIGLGTLATTIVCTGVFTVLAIIRKTYVRLHFEKKHASQ